MLKDGLFTRFPKPDYALAVHDDARLPAGVVGYHAGPILTNADSVDITVFGRGGHGARPEATVDPIVLAARIVLALQTIVSRENSPFDPAVITVGTIHGGTKNNIIPDDVKLQLTVRSFTQLVRERLLAAIRRNVKAEAAAAERASRAAGRAGRRRHRAGERPGSDRSRQERAASRAGRRRPGHAAAVRVPLERARCCARAASRRSRRRRCPRRTRRIAPAGATLGCHRPRCPLPAHSTHQLQPPSTVRTNLHRQSAKMSP